MVKFTVAKKEVAEAMTLLVQVVNIKSRGEIPTDSCCLTFSASTVTITANSAINIAAISDIPISISEGDINEHLDQGINVNLKKFANVIKACGKSVNIALTDTQIIIGEGRKKYSLDMFFKNRYEPPAGQLFPYKIPVKEVLKNTRNFNCVIKSAITMGLTSLGGVVINNEEALVTDRSCIFYLKKPGLFDVDNDIKLFIDTDLLEACLSKTSLEHVMAGITNDGTQLILQLGSILVYKKILDGSDFPEVKLKNMIASIVLPEIPNTVSATINLKQFMDQLRETHSIIEAEDYSLTFSKKENVEQIILSQSNNRIGAGGDASIPANITLNLSEDLAQHPITASFAHVHLQMLGNLFAGDTDVTLSAVVANTHSGVSISQLIVQTEKCTFLCIPKASA